jgi:hypothetical protein
MNLILTPQLEQFIQSQADHSSFDTAEKLLKKII